MTKVTKIKVKQNDAFSEEIDLGAKASNISLSSGEDLETKLNNIQADINTVNQAKYLKEEDLVAITDAEIDAIVNGSSWYPEPSLPE